jgi:hypothetical protein
MVTFGLMVQLNSELDIKIGTAINNDSNNNNSNNAKVGNNNDCRLIQQV